MDIVMGMQSELTREFVGTFVFLGGILAAVRDGENTKMKLSMALVVAATITGAHMNPAVSIMFFMKDGGSSNVLAGRIFAQCIGALATLKAYEWMGNDLKNGKGKKAKDETTFMAEKIFAEFLGTCIFFSGILLSGGDATKVGLALFVAACTIGDVSGGHMNPAVSFMLFVKNSGNVMKMVMYQGAQVAGGIAALQLVARLGH